MHFLALLLVCLLMWCTPLRRALPLDIPQLWVAFAERRIAHRPLVGLALLWFAPGIVTIVPDLISI